MLSRRVGMAIGIFTATAAALATFELGSARSAHACCPAGAANAPVVNADQTVVLIWDPKTKTEHFVRRASFKSQGRDFGFLVPTPTQPELAESGDEAFPYLEKLTAPPVRHESLPSAGCAACTAESKGAAHPSYVHVLEEKTVAGFHAVVLETDSASELVTWLNEHGYAFSPEVEAWAKPYVDGKWKITALRIAKSDELPGVTAGSLRLSFHADAPLFPYREPSSARAAAALGVDGRLLRIYLVSDARYDGALAAPEKWSGRPVYARPLEGAEASTITRLLQVPGAAPATPWITEFEDVWPYEPWKSDLTFVKSGQQERLAKPPVVQYDARSRGSFDLTWVLLGGAFWFARPRRSRR